MAESHDRSSPGFSHTVAPAAVLIAGVVACTVASLVTYWPRLHDYFVLDDFTWLRAVSNHSFLTVMYRAFTFPEPAWDDEVTFFWRPLVDLYFYAAQPVGLRPTAYHLFNFLLHGAVGGLGIFFIWRLTNHLAAAAVSGLLFVMAPTYDFAVTWISQVSELFGAVFILGVLVTYHAYLVAERHRSMLKWATAGIALLAVLSKESAIIVLPLLAALAIAVPPERRRRSWAEIAWSLAPLFVLGAVFSTVMIVHQHQIDAGTFEIGPHMFRNVRDYLEWMVLPFDPRSYALARSLLAGAFIMAGVLSVVLRQRALAFLFVWTIIALMPFSGFVFGIEFRYAYLATLPLAAFVVVGVFTLVEAVPRGNRSLVYGAVGAVFVTALIVTPMRTQDFQGWIVFQSQGYEGMVHGVRSVCGDMPPGTELFLKNVPYYDLFGNSTPAAVSIFYDDVHAYVVDEYPGLIAFIEDKCALEYDSAIGQYVRVTEF
ncbi:MAG: hypothetical protein IIC91_15720 [Chloroflexi bacterium]|nr:hypothetical protein [Chloroflexota bacterium]